MPEPIFLRGFAFEPGIPALPVNSWDALDGRDGGKDGGKDGKRFVWIDAEGEPGAETEARLRERLDWHPIVLQNIRQASLRARLTPFEDYTHLTFFIPVPGGMDEEREGAPDEARNEEVDAILGPGYLITFHRAPIPILTALIAELPGWKTPPKSPDLLLHRLIFSAIEALAPAIDDLDGALNALEDEALNRPGPELLERIVMMRDALFLHHLSLAPQLQMLHDITSGASRFVTPYARPFFRSTENRVRGLIDDVAIYKEVVQNILELYRSAITQSTNDTIRLLTVVSTPFLALTFLTGLYGMNVALPFAGRPHAFAGLVGISIAILLGMLVWFRRRQWF
jgi:magnesium transporter